MKKTILCFLILCFGMSSLVAQNYTKPNIIFILTDDLGYGDLGCFGSKIIKTPHLDKLASAGIKLTQFYSGSTVCAPSRCALMTGKHTGHAYIRGNGEIPLRQQDVILPEILQKAGYTTGMFGKWGLGDINTSGSPHLKGWDEFAGYLHHTEAHYQSPSIGWYYQKGMKNVERGGNGSNGFGGFSSDGFVKKATEFIKRQGTTQPFFAYISLTLPHAELFAPKAAMQRYQDANGNSVFDEKPFEGSHYGGQRMPKAAYAAMVSRVDDYVGQVVNVLKEMGIADNTLIVFSSDNGTHVEGGRTQEDVNLMNSSGGLRGHKRDLTEGGIRVPTIVAGAGLPKGIVREGYGAFWDFVPTFAEIAKAEKASAIDGLSQFSYWKTGQNWQNRPLYWEFYEGGYAQAVRSGDWKYIRTFLPNGTTNEQLYHLTADVGEQNNLVLQNVAQRTVMAELVQTLRTKPEHTWFKAPFDK